VENIRVGVVANAGNANKQKRGIEIPSIGSEGTAEAAGLDVGSLINEVGNSLGQGQSQGQNEGGLDAAALLNTSGIGQKGDSGLDIANIANQLGQGQEGGAANVDISKLAEEALAKGGQSEQTNKLLDEVLNGQQGQSGQKDVVGELLGELEKNGKGGENVEIIQVLETIVQINNGGQGYNSTTTTISEATVSPPTRVVNTKLTNSL
jgi:hypothetical protein